MIKLRKLLDKNEVSKLFILSCWHVIILRMRAAPQRSAMQISVTSGNSRFLEGGNDHMIDDC